MNISTTIAIITDDTLDDIYAIINSTALLLVLIPKRVKNMSNVKISMF